MMPSQKSYLTVGRVFCIIATCVLFTAALFAQPKYRTFSQTDLAEKKAKTGKAFASQVCFTFHNTTTSIVNDLHIKLNSKILAIEDSGGYPTLAIGSKSKVLDASGKTVAPGDSVTLCFKVEKKEPGTKASKWWWTLDGSRIGGRNEDLRPNSDVQIHTQPNGGTVREYLYKRVITRPEGLVIGIPNTSDSGWIRYMKADKKYFPHTGPARCFDFITKGEGGQKPFRGQHRNPHVKKHNNHLLGELHALKLAIIANDSSVTEPLELTATLFGDLLYNDSVNTGDICNGKTLRVIAHLSDSALTYCDNFSSATYTDLDNCISRINASFGGDYVAVTLSPFVVAGTHSLDEVYFLHPNPAVSPSAHGRRHRSIIDELPDAFTLGQNYPNPFNPTTVIEFVLSEPSVVTFKVFNMLGQEVATLLDNENMDAGDQSVEFDASQLTSGVYFYRLDAVGNESFPVHWQASKRMVLIK